MKNDESDQELTHSTKVNARVHAKMKNRARTACMLLASVCVSMALNSCGTDTGAVGLFTVTARNDTQDLTFITNGTNPDVTIPVILNDTVQQMVDLIHDFSGNSGKPFNYDNSVTPWDADSGLSLHINGGNPHSLPFPDAADMGGTVTEGNSNYSKIETVELTYRPDRDSHGVDWFSYTPLGIAAASDTAYVIVRFVAIEQDDYEPDDFIQFANDITQYVTQNIGEHYIESHNSDYPNLDNRAPPISYRSPLSGLHLTIKGDRDWFLIRIPTNESDLAIEIKTIAPKVITYENRQTNNFVENDLGVVLIEEVSGVPPQRPANGPAALHYTQNTDIPLPRPYNSYVLPANAPMLFQNQRVNDGIGYPSPLWFKWPLDGASQFLNTRRLFIRVNPKGSEYGAGGLTRSYFGDYRIDFRLLQKGF